MNLRLASRLDAARRSIFVGRDQERGLLLSALDAAEPPFFVLYVYGPGGVGKTTLLREYQHLCEQQQVAAWRMDARNAEPTPRAFLDALRTVLGISTEEAPEDFLASRPGRQVLMVDTYELLAPLDGWLRDSFLPRLSQDVLVVLAGRNPPAPEWLHDPGWQALVHTLPLRNLSPSESRALLERRRVPAEQQKRVLDFTRGHPLALSLVADMFAQRQGLVFQPENTPDVIKTLVETFVQKAPGPAHRAALEASALVRVINEALLAQMLTLPDPASEAGGAVHELFDWLHSLSFIDSRKGGLFPHDLARDALATDLRWRNPDWYTELHRRARNYYTERLAKTTGEAQQRALVDLVFLHRDNAVVRPFFEWQLSGGALADQMSPADAPELAALTADYEGEASARLAEYWFQRQPGGVHVWRDTNGRLLGFLETVALQDASAEDGATDPAVDAALSYLQQRAPLRPGERALHFRFWMAADTYQQVSVIQSLIFVDVVRYYLTTPALAYTFFPCVEPDFWRPVLTYADLERIPEADYRVGDRDFGVYGHDWRRVPPVAWLSLLAEREVAASPQAVAPAPVEALLVLSRPDFEAAVHDSLRHFSRPDRLQGNPLLASRLVADDIGPGASDEERIEHLRSQIQAAADLLQHNPRDARLHRALDRTYFRPAPTQEAAAELLDLPFSTYRRHLRAGIDQMIDILWRWEVGGRDK